MSKVKSVKKKNNSYIKFKCEKGQSVVESKLYAINTNQLGCLLKISVEDGSKANLIFGTQGLISLREYLAMPLTVKSFAGLLNSILANLDLMKKAYFDYRKVLFDVDLVMVDPSYRTVYFAFVPAEPFENQYDLRRFLLDIAKVGTIDSYDDPSVMDEYISILENGISFSIFDLEEFAKRLTDRGFVPAEQFTICPKCSAQMDVSKPYCGMCGANLNKSTQISAARPSGSPVATVFKSQTGIPFVGNTQFFLVRERTGDKISVGSAPVVFGKDPTQCNYVIRDNPAVSRVHASFYVYNGHLCVEDNGSTNFTFIDSKIVQPGAPCELYPGSKVLLANEVFIVSNQ